MSKIDILYFAWVRERIGVGQERVDLPAGTDDVAGAIDCLARRSGGHAEALGDRTRLRAALDGRFVALDAPLEGARELALFPPVTGG